MQAVFPDTCTAAGGYNPPPWAPWRPRPRLCGTVGTTAFTRGWTKFWTSIIVYKPSGLRGPFLSVCPHPTLPRPALPILPSSRGLSTRDPTNTPPTLLTTCPGSWGFRGRFAEWEAWGSRGFTLL